MGKGPGLFSEIGKKAKDLLNKDYNYDHKFSVTTYTSSGLAFTSSGSTKGEAFVGDVATQLKREKWTTDLKVDTSSNLSATITVDELTTGLKAILNYTLPDQKAGKVELQYKQDYTAVSTSVGLTPAPLAEFSAVIGSSELSLGGEVAVDTATRDLTKYNAALSFTKPDFTASLFLTDKGDTLKFSYLHTLSPISKSSVAAELSHSLSKNENTFLVGGFYLLDPLTIAKARLNHRGKVAALIQHEWRPKSLVTLSGEVDTGALHRDTKLGVSLSMKP